MRERYQGRLLVVCPPQFDRWFVAWRPALERAGWDVVWAPLVGGKTDISAFSLSPTAVLFMNVFGHLDEEEVMLVKSARRRAMPAYFLESWGLGCGVGISHVVGLQRAVVRYVGDSYAGSPIDASYGAHFDYLNLPVWDLLGPASSERSKFVEELKDFEEGMLKLEQAIDDAASATKLTTKSTVYSDARARGRDLSGPKTIAEWAAAAHSNAREKGFWNDFFSGPLMTKMPSALELLGFLMLISREVSEVSEEVRRPGFDPKEVYFLLEKDGVKHPYSDWQQICDKLPKPEGFVVEMADVVLRVVDLCQAMGVDLQRAMEWKHAYNRTRSHMHGGKRA